MGITIDMITGMMCVTRFSGEHDGKPAEEYVTKRKAKSG
mgnify:CR=1 FL=1|jgi:hypothetical protein